MARTPVQPGALNVSALTGDEIVSIAAGASREAQTTTRDIAEIIGSAAFPITSGESGVVSSGGEIVVVNGGLLIINSGGSETVSGTETIASGGVLRVASGGTLGVAGIGTISSGASLLIASGGSETVQSGATLTILSGGIISAASGATVSGFAAGGFPITSGQSGVISSGGSLVIASGGIETVSAGGTATFESGSRLIISSGAVISSGTAQTLETVLGSAGLSPLTPGFATGRWYPPPFVITQSGTGVTLISGTIYGTLFYVPYATSFAALGAWIVTSATGNLLFGAYGPLTSSHMSAALSGAPKLGQTSSAAIGGTATGVSATFTSALLPGWYVGCVMADATPALGRGISNTIAFGEYVFGQATVGAAATVNVGVTAPGITFANGLPSTLPTMTAVGASAVAVVSWMK